MNFMTKRFRIDMKVLLIYAVFLALMPSCRGDEKEDLDAYFSKFIADLWLEGADVVKIIWRDCSKKLVDVKDVIDHKEYFPKFLRCMKRKTLRALDRSLTPDVVPIGDGVSLVRFELVDRSGNIMPENNTSTWSDKELDEGEWRTLALQRMAKVLRTHVIKFDFEDNKALEKVEYRGRRRHHMLTMMMFGIVSIGMVLVPMGFQFLAVLGGKALLLAKMALILASIQGLKKIATSPVSYGFYHSYPPYDHYQKRSQDNWPSELMPTSALSKPQSPWSIDTGDIKIDRIHIADRKDKESLKVDMKDVKKPETKTIKQEMEPRLFPVYLSSSEPPNEMFSSIDAPSLVDLTTRPGEVQADYSLDLPYNGFHFQSPSTVVSA
ncbi:uncharacterized protein Osi23 [Epargyreus clarus]|uniref:uncharacterized protein Osi23 n=1 Tax=Epargyreus clarus TaxID=520877 RepID=UPI003C2F5C42